MNSPSAPIGILGDGQLALMLGEAARAQRIPFLVYGSDPDASAARAFPESFVQGKPNDLESLVNFANRCGALTLENEFYSSDTLDYIEKKTSVPLVPSTSSYRHFESKFAQRSLYRDLQIHSPKWRFYKGHSDQILTSVINDFALPVVIKLSRGGYDGYGVRIASTKDELQKALQFFTKNDLLEVVIEEKVSIKKEFAQGALFNGAGNYILLPLVETVQRNGICELVISRFTLPKEEIAAVETAVGLCFEKLARSNLRGLFNFEFFWTEDKRLLINEGAPRPHNSQHLTLNASSVSQFDLLMFLAHAGKLPDVKSPITAKPSVMVNLLGRTEGEEYALFLPSIPSHVQCYEKLYLKKTCRPGRKMGHVNLIDSSGTEDLVTLGDYVRKGYRL